MDTKPIGDTRDEWLSDPLIPTFQDHRIYGLGSSDMKGAIGAMVFAAWALKIQNIRLRGDLVLCFTADEEAGSEYGAKFLAPLPEARVDAVLIGEPSGWEYDWQATHFACRGVCGFTISCRGTQMHSSLSDRIPGTVNASVKLAELMGRSRELTFRYPSRNRPGWHPTLNVGVKLTGGVTFGVTPGLASCSYDLRTVPGMRLEDVQAGVDHWLSQLHREDPDLNASVQYDPRIEWVPPAELSEDHPLVHAVQESAADVLGQAPPLDVFPGGTDAPWFEQNGIPALPSFGPGILTHCHGPNEYISQKSVLDSAKMYALAAMKFCGVDTGRNAL